MPSGAAPSARPSNAASFAEAPATRDSEGNVEGGVEIQDWDPDTPYLTAIKDTKKIYKSSDSLYKEYLIQRQKYANSPAFYLDCAHLFFKEKQDKLALRILSNLSELKIDDVGLLRVYAWRLREAGDYDNAIVILRKVADIRPDESISWRDLALTLTMRAKKNKNAKDAQEALNMLHKVIFNPWTNESYRDSFDLRNIAIIALEEFNELAAWCKRQGWVGNKVTIPQTDPKFIQNFESDLRIVVSWDADDTDIDLMITEPSGQEVFYGNKCSLTGGILSGDIVDGYGPEEYIHKYAPKGTYKVYTNYFDSHEQSLIGAATVTVTFYSNWGRSNQKSETMTFRLNEVKDKIKVGEYSLK
jgi:tetratricopeptide (TPR) repeat protein